MSKILTVPQIIRPPFEVSQENSLNWLSAALEKSSELSLNAASRRYQRFGCAKDKIANRGLYLKDFTHQVWSKMKIFNLNEEVGGSSKRNEFYSEVANKIFTELYNSSSAPPNDLYHVTCTGYASPSGAQNLVSTLNWGDKTRVTHIYHMGCYAALVALRMASENKESLCTDIVHTELCSLHLNHNSEEPEQLVLNSLFADGACRYTIHDNLNTAGFKIHKNHEEILPDSQFDMTWSSTDTGFGMTLSRKVPEKIKSNVVAFVNKLIEHHDIDVDKIIFAIHPGGPLIIKNIQEALSIREFQVRQSHRVLLKYGNMSSATLPYIWEEIYNDPEVPNGQKVISLAFGPGLTICGSLLEVWRP